MVISMNYPDLDPAVLPYALSVLCRIECLASHAGQILTQWHFVHSQIGSAVYHHIPAAHMQKSQSVGNAEYFFMQSERPRAPITAITKVQF